MPNEKSSSIDLLEALLLRVGEHAVGQLLGVRRRQRRQRQPLEMAVDADLRRRLGRDDAGRIRPSRPASSAGRAGPCVSSPHQPYFTVSRTTSSMRRHAVLDFPQAALAERDHAFVNRLAAQFEAGRADENQLAQLLADFHHFVEADAALVAGVVAAYRSRRPCIGITVLASSGVNPACTSAGAASDSAPCSSSRRGGRGAGRKSDGPSSRRGTARCPCSSDG